MNSFKMVAAVATVLMTTGAYAQSSSTATSAMPAAAAAPAPATSTASLDEAKKDVAARPWKVELYHSTETPMTNLTYNKGVSKTSNYVGFKSKVFGDKSAGIRQIFTANYMSNDQKSDVKVGNTYLHFTDPKLFTLNNGIEGTGVVRLYLPTGETARFISKDNGSVRLYLIGAKSFGKVDLDVTLLGQAWANTQDGFTAGGKFVSNTDYYLYPSFNAGYNFTDTLSVAQSLGTENLWYRAQVPTRSFNSTTTVAWKAMKELTLTANLSNDVVYEGNDLQDRGYVPFRDDENTVIIEAIVNL